jgi:hypothetical protein
MWGSIQANCGWLYGGFLRQKLYPLARRLCFFYPPTHSRPLDYPCFEASFNTRGYERKETVPYYFATQVEVGHSPCPRFISHRARQEAKGRFRSMINNACCVFS